MFIKRYGAGERIFLGLHGWGGTHLTFEPLIRFLPTDASLFAVDLPGGGQTPAPAARDWDLAAIADQLAAEIAKLESRSITLIGNCSGGIIGLAAMPQIAGSIDRLVLIDPFAYAPWYFKLLTSPGLGDVAYYSTFANPVGRWIANLSLIKHRAEGTNLTATFGRTDHRAAHRYLKLFTKVSDPRAFAWLSETPIDIVYGERTFAAVKASIPIWKRVWPQARAFELMGAGHLPILEATEELSRIIFRCEV